MTDEQPKKRRGCPKGEARRKGKKNKATLLREAGQLKTLETATSEGKTPLEVLLELMRDAHSEIKQAEAVYTQALADIVCDYGPPHDPEDKEAVENRKALWQALERAKAALAGARERAQSAAKDAAPYVHGRIAQIDVNDMGAPTIVLAKFEFGDEGDAE